MPARKEDLREVQISIVHRFPWCLHSETVASTLCLTQKMIATGVGTTSAGCRGNKERIRNTGGLLTLSKQAYS